MIAYDCNEVNEVIAPKKAPTTFHTNKAEMKNLRESFGHYPPLAVTPVDVYKYIDRRGQIAPVRANREKALLSHVFSMAIRWGAVRDNPCRNVKCLTEQRGDRYVTNVEYWRICKAAPDNLKNLIRLAYITGLRQTDLLKIKLVDIKKDGLFVKISKTQKSSAKNFNCVD